jgi:hypothetical protein
VLPLVPTHNFSPLRSLLQSPSMTTSTITYVVRYATILAFIHLAQVLGSPNKLFTWSRQVVQNNSSTYFYRKSNQPSTFPDFICNQIYGNSYGEFFDHPPCLSSLFHHKLFSWHIQGVHPDQLPWNCQLEHLS